MRIISFNVNGVRAISGKIKSGEKTGTSEDNCLTALITEQKPDVLCLQEIKTQDSKDLEHLKKHFKYIFTNHSKSKKGYSGVALLTNEKPQWISYDFQMYTEEQIGAYKHQEFMNEGRIITAKFKTALIVTVYVPNSKDELARLSERIEWEALMRNYLALLKKEIPTQVIYCGDLNIAPMEIDIHNPKGKSTVAGFSTEERAEFQKLLKVGFVDSFRVANPITAKYSYFSNFHNSRQKNLGWRIDLILTSDETKVRNADCLTEYFGSDHCPVVCDL